MATKKKKLTSLPHPESREQFQSLTYAAPMWIQGYPIFFNFFFYEGIRGYLITKSFTILGSRTLYMLDMIFLEGLIFPLESKGIARKISSLLK